MEETITKIEILGTSDNHRQKHWMKNLKPWKPGQSGNPKGRPKGRSLKEYTREYFAHMTEEERTSFLKGIKPEFIWLMAEGAPRAMVEVEEPYNPFGNMTDVEVVENLQRYLKQYEAR